MKIEDFKSGKYIQQYQYKSFSPNFINQEWSWDNPSINTLLADANRALGELNAFSLIIPDIDLFVQMHVVKEANTSSRIEGTQTGIDEAFMEKEQIQPEKRDDWQEVNNYIVAMNNALKELKDLPLSNRLLKNAHKTLMKGVRGKHKCPGEFRKSQNWIGGTDLQNAFFIPPAHEEVPALMSDLEKFWHNETVAVPHLVRIAITHYQFETIHPFCDGNGRIGRLMIPLYLISSDILKKPSLYISDYFERHKGAYYDSLTVVRASNDMSQWIKFFLVAVRDTAVKARIIFQNVLKLREKTEHQIVILGGKTKNARKLLMHLYTNPFVKVNHVLKLLNVSHQTANALVKDFVNLGILVEMTGMARNRTFVFDEYFKLFIR